jgi:hypothetical protein
MTNFTISHRRSVGFTDSDGKPVFHTGYVLGSSGLLSVYYYPSNGTAVAERGIGKTTAGHPLGADRRPMTLSGDYVDYQDFLVEIGTDNVTFANRAVVELSDGTCRYVPHSRPDLIDRTSYPTPTDFDVEVDIDPFDFEQPWQCYVGSEAWLNHDIVRGFHIGRGRATVERPWPGEKVPVFSIYEFPGGERRLVDFQSEILPISACLGYEDDDYFNDVDPPESRLCLGGRVLDTVPYKTANLDQYGAWLFETNRVTDADGEILDRWTDGPMVYHRFRPKPEKEIDRAVWITDIFANRWSYENGEIRFDEG